MQNPPKSKPLTSCLSLNPPLILTISIALSSSKPISPNPKTAPKSFSSDEFPVAGTFLDNFAPKDKETGEEAHRRNWIERGCAPWEEIITPEADFARKSLNESEEVPFQTPQAIEAFKMPKPSYRL